MFRTSSVHHQERFVQAVFADFGMWYYCAYYSTRSAVTELWEDYTYIINLSVFITEAECLLRGTNWVFKLDRWSFVLKRLIYGLC